MPRKAADGDSLPAGTLSELVAGTRHEMQHMQFNMMITANRHLCMTVNEEQN